MNPFIRLGLSSEIVETLHQLGLQEPTEIQKHAIPNIITGNDILAIAQTGTGKIAAYTLPSIERLKKYANHSTSPAMHPVRMLVLVPTRELAQQVQENIATFVNNIPLKCAVLFGGININLQIQTLAFGVEILIATVGRLNDLIQQKAVQLNQVEIVILDEADKMLDIGFYDDFKKIFSYLPIKKQIILFSATFSKPIEHLTQELLYHPKRIEITQQNITNSKIEQHFIGIDEPQKKSLLFALISQLNLYQVMVFCNTKVNVESVTRFLRQNKIPVLSIHGNKTQKLRIDTLQQFKQGQIQTLVSTDVAARGLDINAVPCVINYDLPQQSEDYVHRIGRTGRARSNGVAISLVEEPDLEIYVNILKFIQQDIQLEWIDHYNPYWRYQKPTAVQTKQPLLSLLNMSIYPNHHVNVIHNTTRLKRGLHQQEDCALLLPNYGLNNTH